MGLASGTFGPSLDLRARPLGLRRSDSIVRARIPPKDRTGLHFWIEAARNDIARCNVSGRLARSMVGEDPTMATSPSDTDELVWLRAAAAGDEAAGQRLL